jgi:hypothetical protein
MSDIVDDVGSVFDSIGDAVSDVFSSGASDAATTATGTTITDFTDDAADAAESDYSTTLGTSAADAYNQLGAASYNVGTATGSWGSDLNTTSTFGDAVTSGSYGTGYDLGSSSTGLDNFDMNAPVYTNMALGSAENGVDATMASTSSFAPASTLGVQYSGTASGASGGSSGGLLSSLLGGSGGSSSLGNLGMYQMMGNVLGSLITAGGAYLASKPKPPNNFSGRGPNGGAGLTMHTTNGGFGLAPGGSTAAPGAPRRISRPAAVPGIWPPMRHRQQACRLPIPRPRRHKPVI